MVEFEYLTQKDHDLVDYRIKNAKQNIIINLSIALGNFILGCYSFLLMTKVYGNWIFVCSILQALGFFASGWGFSYILRVYIEYLELKDLQLKFKSYGKMN